MYDKPVARLIASGDLAKDGCDDPMFRVYKGGRLYIYGYGYSDETGTDAITEYSEYDNLQITMNGRVGADPTIYVNDDNSVTYDGTTYTSTRDTHVACVYPAEYSRIDVSGG